jgi:hypothetical protein|tara:strand:- start:1221 stop:2423 length:1203 start_codon:yes stop_codon:yes gene_type:complete
MRERQLFQVLDTKADCVGYYIDNMINPGKSLPLEGDTWEYSPHLCGEIYEIAQIYGSGATLTEACPPEMKEEWETIKKTLRGCLKAFGTSQVSLHDNCLYDLIPEYFLFQYLKAKNQITQHVLDTCERPPNYDAMYHLLEMLADIKARPLNLHIKFISHLLSSVKGKNFLRTLRSVKPVCDYNPWGTVTGRLSTRAHTFPVLTMGKEFRSCVLPHNDWFIELDFNAAELRTLIALTGAEQPKNDIHDWNAKNIYCGLGTRDEAKKRIFAWMYNPQSEDTLSNGAYDKESVKDKYWDGFKIETDYGRVIENVDEHHALNYIVQSTTIDMVHEQAYKVYKLLEGMKSNIAFLIHDAVYIDLAEDDRYEILNLLDTFKQTRYNMFKVNVSAGRNLGEMKELKL